MEKPCINKVSILSYHLVAQDDPPPLLPAPASHFNKTFTWEIKKIIL